jgi:uncharacterized membrane protein
LIPPIKGFIRMSLAHHPVCALYNNHLIRIKGVSLCLGCTALYSGMFIGIILLITGILYTIEWKYLVLVAFIMFLPTILRLLDFSIFGTSNKNLRFFYRFILGLGIIIGIASILKAPTIQIQIIQF